MFNCFNFVIKNFLCQGLKNLYTWVLFNPIWAVFFQSSAAIYDILNIFEKKTRPVPFRIWQIVIIKKKKIAIILQKHKISWALV